MGQSAAWLRLLICPNTPQVRGVNMSILPFDRVGALLHFESFISDMFDLYDFTSSCVQWKSPMRSSGLMSVSKPDVGCFYSYKHSDKDEPSGIWTKKTSLFKYGNNTSESILRHSRLPIIDMLT